MKQNPEIINTFKRNYNTLKEHENLKNVVTPTSKHTSHRMAATLRNQTKTIDFSQHALDSPHEVDVGVQASGGSLLEGYSTVEDLESN